MSETGESLEHEKELEDNNDQQMAVLKAILAGIALIADKDVKDLIELAKGL